MFETGQDIITALRRSRDSFDPRTSSLLAPQRVAARPGEPFRTGFLSTLEERAELQRLLRVLPEQQQRLLILWFVQGQPVAEIARRLKISRVHCYRLKKRALDAMVAAQDERAADAGFDAG